MPERDSLSRQCGRVMVGSGTDSYDPVCEMQAGHSGPCKSTAATDQHRTEWVCPKCGTVMPGPNMLCSGSFLDTNHPPNVQPRLREEQTWPAPGEVDSATP